MAKAADWIQEAAPEREELKIGLFRQIGEAARRGGLTTSSLRFYEEQGLITSRRTAGGQRRYARSDIRRLSFVMIAQTFGFTIGEIQAQLAGPIEGPRQLRSAATGDG